MALVNSSQSVKNGKQIFGLLKALGTTDPDVTIARQNLYRNIQDPKAMVEINKGIEGQREHFDNLGLHIGYVYGDKEVPSNVSIFHPSCVSGARLPHAWIKVTPGQLQLPVIDNSYVHEFTADEVSAKQYSTLDLCRLDTFTLIVDESNASHFKSIVNEAFETLPEDIQKVLPLQTVVLGVDFDLQAGPENQSWMRLMRLEEQGVLIRPDQHILSCIPSKAGSGDLVQALKEHLGWH